MSKKQVIELEWFSVDEKLPDVGKSCLIRMSNSKVLLDYYVQLLVSVLVIQRLWYMS
jgi:hypothetical protein